LTFVGQAAGVGEERAGNVSEEFQRVAIYRGVYGVGRRAGIVNGNFISRNSIPNIVIRTIRSVTRECGGINVDCDEESGRFLIMWAGGMCKERSNETKNLERNTTGVSP